MIFVDTNVILDVLQDDDVWAGWSIDRLSDGSRGEVVINPVVIAELSRDYASLAELHRVLAPFEFSLEPLDDLSGFVAGHRFVEALRGKPADVSKRPLPDFFIGAHAVTLKATLLTRDPRLYRRYFPELALITPETHP